MAVEAFFDTNILLYGYDLDAVILAAAQSSGARKLYSEDLSPGQDYGGVRAMNPFQ